MAKARKQVRTLALIAVGVCALPGAMGRAVAELPSASPSFDAVVVATAHDSEAQTSEVRAIHFGAVAATTRALGVIAHPPGAVVRGDVRDGTVWIVADEETNADFGAALYQVRTGQGARRVLGGVGHARRPLASATGWVFVERGRVGVLPTSDEILQGKLRVDSVAIEGYGPRTSTSRTLYSSDVYALHIAGEHRGELIVYRVAPEGASLLAIDETTGAARVVCPVMPFARDFSVDAAHDAILLSNRDAADRHTWTIERVDLVSGLRTRLHAAHGEQPAALALPSGDTAWTADARRGLVVAGRAIAPLGAGFDAPVLATKDGALVAIEHLEADQDDRAAVVDVATGRAFRIGAGERITVLELDGSTGGVR